MKLSKVILSALASSFFSTMTVQANDSLVGFYSCELNEALPSVRGMGLRAGV